MAQQKKGRPASDDSMKDRIFIRINKQTKEKLNECKKILNLTTSDVVRKGIDKIHDDIKK